MPAAPSSLAQAARAGLRNARWRLFAGALWVIPLLVVSIVVATRPEKRTVTPLYHAAAERWWQREALYDGPGGMNYLPPFALLFGPYHVLPRPVSEVVWRATAAAGLAAGLWCLVGSMPGANRWKAFALVSVCVLPLSLPAIRNGQANAQLGAALLLAAVALKAQRWWLAVVLLCVATAIKPLGLAAVGLAWAAYPRMGWRLGVGLLVLMALPFGFGPVDYAARQFVACFENLRQCADVTEHRFADLNGLLRTFGTALTGKASLAVRAGAGALLMGLCWRASRQRTEPRRALVWLGAAAGFLMLFNPMTEENSYVILAPALGLTAWQAATGGAHRRGWLFAGMALTMGLLPNLLRPWLGNQFALAWHPAMTLIFLAVLSWEVLRDSAAGSKSAPGGVRVAGDIG